MKITNIDWQAVAKKAKTKSSIKVLNYTAVQDGRAIQTDLETGVVWSSDQMDGLYLDGVRIPNPDGLCLDDFPLVPDFKLGNTAFVLDADTAKHLAGFVDFASKNELRPALTGIYLDAPDGHLRAVATDGHRLRLQEFDVTGWFDNWPKYGLSGSPAIITPAKFWNLIKIMSKSNHPIKFYFEQVDGVGYVIAQPEQDSGYIYSQTIQAAYPNFERVIPTPEELKSTLTADVPTMFKESEKLRKVAKQAVGSNPTQENWRLADTNLIWLDADVDLQQKWPVEIRPDADTGRIDYSNFCLLMPVKVDPDFYQTGMNYRYLARCWKDFANPVLWLPKEPLGNPMIICES